MNVATSSEESNKLLFQRKHLGKLWAHTYSSEIHITQMSLNKLNQVFGNKLKIWPMATKAESNKMENGIQANFPFYNQWVVLKQKKKKS